MNTWPNGRWQEGGGPVWGWISYDPKTNLIFYGTGNPGPWNSNQREGDNKWTTTIFARDADTGEAVWADQLNPHDMYDYDEINENLLLDLPINGQTRPVLVHPGRDGFMFVIDRADRADLFRRQIRYPDLDQVLRPQDRAVRCMNDALKPLLGKNISGICPASPGVKDWQPTAYSPQTQLLYIPHQHLCMDFKTSEAAYIPGTPYVGATVDMYAGPGGYRGEFAAWDPVKRKKVWAIHEKFPVWTGTMVTAGNIAVYGTMDRWFKVVDARNGKLLYQFHAPSAALSASPSPIRARMAGNISPCCRASAAGRARWPMPRSIREVRNGALGYTGAVGDLPAVTSGGSTLMVFALPSRRHAMKTIVIVARRRHCAGDRGGPVADRRAGRRARAACWPPPIAAWCRRKNCCACRSPASIPAARRRAWRPTCKIPWPMIPMRWRAGARDFDSFNCCGCHMARGGGGMGPALSQRHLDLSVVAGQHLS